MSEIAHYSREDEVCSLKWEWEQKVPELGTSVFVIPGDRDRDCEVDDRGSTRDASGVRFRTPGKGWSRRTAEEDVRHRPEECWGTGGERMGAGT